MIVLSLLGFLSLLTAFFWIGRDSRKPLSDDPIENLRRNAAALKDKHYEGGQ